MGFRRRGIVVALLAAIVVAGGIALGFTIAGGDGRGDTGEGVGSSQEASEPDHHGTTELWEPSEGFVEAPLGATSEPQVAWRYALPSSAAEVAADKTGIYVVDPVAGAVIGVDPITGEERWYEGLPLGGLRNPPSATIEILGAGALGIQYQDGRRQYHRVVVSTDDGSVLFELTPPPPYSDAVSAGDVFIETREGELVGRDREGEELWEVPGTLVQRREGQLLAFQDLGLPSDSPRISRIDTRGGRLAWTIEAEMLWLTTVANGDLLVSQRDEPVVTAFDLETGDQLWKRPFPVDSVEAMIASSDDLVAISGSDKIVAVDPDGEVAWEAALSPNRGDPSEPGITSIKTGAGPRLIAQDGRNLSLMDATTGKRLARVDGGGGPVRVADDVVYVLGGRRSIVRGPVGDTLTGLDVDRLDRQWQLDLSDSSHALTTVDGGLVMLTDDNVLFGLLSPG